MRFYLLRCVLLAGMFHVAACADDPAIPGEELTAAACANGVDDDADGLVDCFDPACRVMAQCATDGALPDAHIDGPSDGGTDSPTDAGYDAFLGICGDSVINDHEDCDDGNTTDGDGCTDACTRETLNCADPSDFRQIRIGDRVRGETSGQPNLTSSSCGGSDAPEDVYYITFDTAVPEVIINVASSFATVVYATTTGCAASDEYTCSLTTDTGPAGLAFGVSAGESFFIIVDGRSGQHGNYELSVDVVHNLPDGAECDPAAHSVFDQCNGYTSTCVDGPDGGICTPYDVIEGAICGDSTISYGAELCDDGNTTNGDGCDSHCMLEPSPCDGVIPALPLNGTVTGTLTGVPNTTLGTCGGGAVGERVYTFDLPEQSFVTIDTNAAATTFRPVFYMRTTCADPSYAVSEITCSWGSAPGYAVTGGSPLDAGLYYVFIDGFDGEVGDYEIRTHTYSLVPEGGACLLAGAGEAGKCAVGLECFETLDGQFCLDTGAVIGSAVCGDNEITVPNEICDDGNTTPGDGCNALCRIEDHVCTSPTTLPTLPENGTVHGDTTGLSSTTYSSCGGAQSGELAYRFELPTQSTVYMTVVPEVGFHPVISIRNGCTVGYQTLACQNETDISLAGLGFLPLDAGTYYVFIDGQLGTHGEFDLNMHTVPLVGEGGECFDWMAVPEGHCQIGLRCVDYATGGRCEPE